MAYRLPFGAVGMRSKYPLATSSSRVLGAWRCSAANFRTDCVSSAMIAATCSSLGAAVPAADEVPGDALEPDFPQPDITARQQARTRAGNQRGFTEPICNRTRTSQFRTSPQLARAVLNWARVIEELNCRDSAGIGIDCPTRDQNAGLRGARQTTRGQDAGKGSGPIRAKVSTEVDLHASPAHKLKGDRGFARTSLKESRL